MAAFGSRARTTVDPDYKQNGVNFTFPAGAPAGYAPGDHVVFSVSGWSMTNALDTKDTAVTVKVGATTHRHGDAEQRGPGGAARVRRDRHGQHRRGGPGSARCQAR